MSVVSQHRWKNNFRLKSKLLFKNLVCGHTFLFMKCWYNMILVCIELWPGSFFFVGLTFWNQIWFPVLLREQTSQDSFSKFIILEFALLLFSWINNKSCFMYSELCFFCVPFFIFFSMFHSWDFIWNLAFHCLYCCCLLEFGLYCSQFLLSDEVCFGRTLV